MDLPCPILFFRMGNIYGFTFTQLKRGIAHSMSLILHTLQQIKEKVVEGEFFHRAEKLQVQTTRTIIEKTQSADGMWSFQLI